MDSVSSSSKQFNIYDPYISLCAKQQSSLNSLSVRTPKHQPLEAIPSATPEGGAFLGLCGGRKTRNAGNGMIEVSHNCRWQGRPTNYHLVTHHQTEGTYPLSQESDLLPGRFPAGFGLVRTYGHTVFYVITSVASLFPTRTHILQTTPRKDV
jgi:hypothetical protein